jgi:N-methylhydantoinase A
VELMTCRLTAVGYTPPVQLEEIGPGASLDQARTGTRLAYFIEIGDFVETPVYDRYKMGEGLSFHGPAIVEERESTTIIGPSASVTVDRYRNLIIDLDR